MARREGDIPEVRNDAPSRRGLQAQRYVARTVVHFGVYLQLVGLLFLAVAFDAMSTENSVLRMTQGLMKALWALVFSFFIYRSLPSINFQSSESMLAAVLAASTFFVANSMLPDEIPTEAPALASDIDAVPEYHQAVALVRHQYSRMILSNIANVFFFVGGGVASVIGHHLEVSATSAHANVPVQHTADGGQDRRMDPADRP